MAWHSWDSWGADLVGSPSTLWKTSSSPDFNSSFLNKGNFSFPPSLFSDSQGYSVNVSSFSDFESTPQESLKVVRFHHSIRPRSSSSNFCCFWSGFPEWTAQDSSQKQEREVGVCGWQLISRSWSKIKRDKVTKERPSAIIPFLILELVGRKVCDCEI